MKCIEIMFVLAAGILAGCQPSEPSATTASQPTRSPADSVRAVNAALDAAGIMTHRSDWTAVLYVHDRAGRVIRMRSTMPGTLDGTYLVWLPVSGDPIILSER